MRARLSILAVLLFAGLGAYLATAQTPRKPEGADKEIRAAAEAFAAAFSKGDFDTVIGFWAEDADYVDEGGAAHKGKAAIAAMMKKAEKNLKGYTMKIDVASVRFPRPDVALDEGTVTLTSPDGAADSNRYVSVWVKNDGRWLLSNVRDQAAAPAADAKFEPLKPLAWLVGEWSFSGSNVTVNIKCRWALRQQYLLLEYDVTRKNGESSQVVQWMGWDAASGQIRTWVFDSDGGYGQAFWERDGNTWTSNADGVLNDGRTGSSTNSIQFVDENSFIWRSRNREIAGNPVPDGEVKFSRATKKEDK